MQNTSNLPFDYRAKICVMGSTNIGKTAMIKGYCTNQYSDRLENPTTGLEIKRKRVMIKEKVIELEIWDTSGLERFQEITFSYFKGMNGFVLVYSIIKQDTFYDLSRFMNALEERGYRDFPKVLVGTNLEMDEYDPEKDNQELFRMVSYDEAEEFAERNGMLYFEINVRNGKNVQQPFEGLIERLIEEWESKRKNNVLKETFQLRNKGNGENRNGQSKCTSCGP